MSELEHGKQTYQQTLQNFLPANTTNSWILTSPQILASTGVYSRKPPHVEEEICLGHVWNSHGLELYRAKQTMERKKQVCQEMCTLLVAVD